MLVNLPFSNVGRVVVGPCQMFGQERVAEINAFWDRTGDEIAPGRRHLPQGAAVADHHAAEPPHERRAERGRVQDHADARSRLRRIAAERDVAAHQLPGE